MSQKVSKTPKKTQNYPKMDQIWKLFIEQNIEMKSYQSTLGDLKISSLWPNCITNTIAAQNNKIYGLMMLKMKSSEKRVSIKRATLQKKGIRIFGETQK